MTISGLYLQPNPPASDDPGFQRFYKYWVDYELGRAKLLETRLLANVSPFKVGTVTVDLGSAEVSYTGAGAAAVTAFNGLSLANTTTTTSNVFQTALNYTGSGALMMVVGLSQVAGAASTAAGMSVQITIDGTVLYTGSLCSAVNKLRAAVGRVSIIDTTNGFIAGDNHPIGLTFLQTCKVEFKSGTNGQGVSIGWDVLKLS